MYPHLGALDRLNLKEVAHQTIDTLSKGFKRRVGLAAAILHEPSALILDALIIHPGIWIEWEPRREWWKFLKHLYDRGPGFAEYHIFERRGWLFYLVLMGFLGLLAVLSLLVVLPKLALGVLALGLAALVLSTLFFSKSVKEFFVLAPLHTLSLIAYGLGAVNGARVVFFSRQTGKKSG